MDKSVFLDYNKKEVIRVRSFIYKNAENTEAVSSRYIQVNNFGYYEDIEHMDLRREKGRIDYQLIYVKRGEISVGRGEARQALKSGGLCLFRPGEAQIYGIEGVATTFFWIHFSGAEAASMLSFFHKQIYEIGIFPEFEQYCRSAGEKIESASEHSSLLYEGRLIALIAKTAERVNSGGRKDNSIMKIRPALIAMHSDSQKKLNNERLAALCALSKYYFIKVFKEAMGTTPRQYHNSVIVNKGCYLLSNTAYNIAEISRLCGVEDSLYFSRIFKKQTGLSPSEYRKKA